ncbi:MAG: trypsin-like peptidase domain-containing protein [Clostridiales bacterium]|nr:trypsin-like peptidase domain-containing protein [Clostridiales bacterium]
MLNEYDQNAEYNMNQETQNQEFQQPEMPAAYTEAPQTTTKSKKHKNGKRIGLVAGILSGALILGAAGGYGGSALYNATNAPAVTAQGQMPGERPDGQFPGFNGQNGQGEMPERPDANSDQDTDNKQDAPEVGDGQFPFGAFGQKDQQEDETSDKKSSKKDTSADAETSDANASLQVSTKSNGQSLSTQEIASCAADAVVEITTEAVKTGNYMQQYVASGAGSGVIISEDGYIITNNHVIEDATQITVTTTDGTAYEAKLVGRDDNLDVALLKIEASGLTVASFGDSDQLALGEEVVAIGNPLGQLGGTVTEGIVSSLNREITIDGKAMTLLQTDAAINPGNSGGGLFNDQGQLIGLVVAKSSGEDVEGLGFAIPINNVQAILNDLLNYGYTKGKAYLGVSLLDITSEQMARMYNVTEIGTYIYSVQDGSAAADAGLKSGDRIISVNGQEIADSDALRELISASTVGDTLEFVIQRGLGEDAVTVTVGEYVPEAMPAVSR